MGFSEEHVLLIQTTRNYLKEKGVPINTYTLANFGDEDLWLCTYVDYDYLFTTEIKNKFLELGVKYDPRHRPNNS
jgi:hypothetical protein|tara:strand:- start:1830 stop:2054 length:225 start_codon:yes stop_codon:yes gene_type:complete